MEANFLLKTIYDRELLNTWQDSQGIVDDLNWTLGRLNCTDSRADKK